MIHLLLMILSHGFTTLSTYVCYCPPFDVPAMLLYILIGGPAWNIALIFSIQHFDNGFLCHVGHALWIIFKLFDSRFYEHLLTDHIFPHPEISFITQSFGVELPFLVVMIFLCILSFLIPVMSLQHMILHLSLVITHLHVLLLNLSLFFLLHFPYLIHNNFGWSFAV